MSRHTNGAGLDPPPSDEQLLESAARILKSIAVEDGRFPMYVNRVATVNAWLARARDRQKAIEAARESAPKGRPREQP